MENSVRQGLQSNTSQFPFSMINGNGKCSGLAGVFREIHAYIHTYNEKNDWIGKLRDNYCKDVETTISDVKLEHFLSVAENLKNNTSPGIDLIVGYWIKICHSTKMKTFELFKEVSKGEKI